MNRVCITTVVSGDHYCHYIPMFLRCLRRWGDGVDSKIYIKGYADKPTSDALNILRDYEVVTEFDYIVEGCFKNTPDLVSTSNTLRFLNSDKELEKYEAVLIVDIDLMLFEDPFPYHVAQMIETRQPYAGHRGPRKRPYRPELNDGNGWTGDFERVAGGFVCVTPEWYRATKLARHEQGLLLMSGNIGGYRESDEVTLARIIKQAGLEMPESKAFPTNLRGLHIGDFKESMTHRWTSMAKMCEKLTAENAHAWKQIQQCPCMRDVIELLCDTDKVLAQELANINQHIRERGI